jgi:hypothetical protein
MILPRRLPVNFASKVLGYKKFFGSEILQRTAKKYKEQLEFNLKIITN